MDSKIQKFFTSAFHIRPDELKLVQTFFLYYVCFGMFITVSYTVGDSLFLTNVTQERVLSLYAWGHVGVAIASILVTWMYDNLMGRFSRIELLTGMPLILLLSILIFRQVIPSSGGTQASDWLYFGLVIWLKVCCQLLIMLFFSFAGDYFTAHDAKRLYGYIAGGLAVGSIIAGAMTGQVVSVIGAQNLLYVCMGFLAAGMGFSLVIHKIGEPVTQQETSSDKEMKTKAPLRAIFSQTYIQLVFLFALIGVVCFVIVDFQMKVYARSVYPSSADLAAFLGNFYMYAGIMTILFQFLLVEFLLRRFGIIYCLMILPGIYMLMSMLFYITGYGVFARYTLFIITATNFFRIMLSEALVLPARELLFLPLPSPLRVRAQAISGGMIVSTGQGVGGLFVMGFTILRIPLFQYSLFVLFFAVVWLVILFLERPRYRETLISSLKNNQLDAIELKDSIQTSSIDFVLEELLKSDEEQIVSFTLDLLKDRSPGALSPLLRKVALGSKPSIAVKALELLGADGDIDHLDTFEQALKSDENSIREAAVLAFCQIQQEDALERVSQWLDAPDQITRQAAIVGCGRHCDQAGVELTQPILKRMVTSPASDARRVAARLLRDIRNPANAFLVENLLDDPDLIVRIEAVEACGAIRSPDLVSHLLRLYKSTEMRVYVMSALEQMPEEAVPAISEAVRDPDLDEAACTMLFQVLACIGGRSAQKTLWKFFSGEFPVVTRVAAGNALRRIATHGHLQDLNEAEFDARLKSLCEEIQLLNQGCREVDDRDKFTWQLMNDHAQLEIECLFQLLAFKYNVHQIEKVRYNFFNPSLVQRANALELLDDILPRRIAPGIVHLLDSFIEEKTQAGRSLSKGLIQQLMQKETWLRVITAYHLSGGALEPGTQAGEVLTEGEREVYKLLERILFLKKVPLFKDVPGDYLVPLAKIAHSVKLRGGEILFHQGDQGDAMYLICHGSISIQVNEVEVNRMGVGECIGEMALLDGAPRSASCVAEEDTKLLKISENDFEIVVKSQTNVALAVLRTLAGRLRQQTANPVKSEETEDVHHSNEEDSVQQIMKKETKREKVLTDHLSRKAPGLEKRAREGFRESERVLYNLFERISFLKKVPLFEEVPENNLIPLAKIAHSVTLKDGEILFYQGDRGDAMYLIRDGFISVQIHGVEVNRMGVGECLGEMALLDDTPRSASCVAEGHTELLRIGANDFETVVKSQTSVVFAMLRTLAGRLRQQTANSTQQEG